MRIQPTSKDALWHEDGGGLRYETLPWVKLQGTARHCSFCSLVHDAIVEHTDSRNAPAPATGFIVTIGLRVVDLHDGSRPFEILSFVVNGGTMVPDSYDYTICIAPGKLTLCYQGIYFI
jgi:hypothetical protein